MKEVVSCRVRLRKLFYQVTLPGNIGTLFLSLFLSTLGEYDSALFALGKICAECKGREGESCDDDPWGASYRLM